MGQQQAPEGQQVNQVERLLEIERVRIRHSETCLLSDVGLRNQFGTGCELPFRNQY